MRKVDGYKEMFIITITDPVKMSDKILKSLQVLIQLQKLRK